MKKAGAKKYTVVRMYTGSYTFFTYDFEFPGGSYPMHTTDPDDMGLENIRPLKVWRKPPKKSLKTNDYIYAEE